MTVIPTNIIMFKINMSDNNIYKPQHIYVTKVVIINKKWTYLEEEKLHTNKTCYCTLLAKHTWFLLSLVHVVGTNTWFKLYWYYLLFLWGYPDTIMCSPVSTRTCIIHQKDHENATKSIWTGNKIYLHIQHGISGHEQSRFTYTYDRTPMKYFISAVRKFSESFSCWGI
jgi:hypothetical protein